MAVLRTTNIYFESTSRLFIVHFDKGDRRVLTMRFASNDPNQMAQMGREVTDWELGGDLHEQIAVKLYGNEPTERQLATTAYMLERGHTCTQCERSNVPCVEVKP